MAQMQISELLEEVYVGQERLTRDTIHRHAVAAGAAPDVVAALDRLPEGEYSLVEVTEVLVVADQDRVRADLGVPANQLTDDDLSREVTHLHQTREQTFRHGSEQALARHDERTAELEEEYLRRNPQREVDPDRLRSGARLREPVQET
ncbi:MAG: DUF2795 domain-containing protein [Micromonosporaceae bacterium]|nr:DUF2795 domain-containing protein [Micromonosporaceae bacterium]